MFGRIDIWHHSVSFVGDRGKMQPHIPNHPLLNQTCLCGRKYQYLDSNTRIVPAQMTIVL